MLSLSSWLVDVQGWTLEEVWGTKGSVGEAVMLYFFGHSAPGMLCDLEKSANGPEFQLFICLQEILEISAM